MEQLRARLCKSCIESPQLEPAAAPMPPKKAKKLAVQHLIAVDMGQSSICAGSFTSIMHDMTRECCHAVLMPDVSGEDCFDFAIEAHDELLVPFAYVCVFHIEVFGG